MHRFVSLLALTVVLSACGSPRPSVGPPGDALTEDGLSLSTPASSYVRGQPIPLRLHNAGDDTFGGAVLGCAGVERWAHHRWEAVDLDRACVAMFVEIAPGGTLTAEIPLDLPAGSYRFVHSMTEVGDEDDTVTVATRAFRLGTGRAQP